MLHTAKGSEDPLVGLGSGAQEREPVDRPGAGLDQGAPAGGSSVGKVLKTGDLPLGWHLKGESSTRSSRRPWMLLPDA